MPGPERVLNERGGGELVTVEVPRSHTVAGDQQPAGDAHRHRAVVVVDDVHARVGDGAADGDRPRPLYAAQRTELIADRVWRSRSQLELAIVAYVGWFNHQRLHSAPGDIPPAEHEALHEFRYAAARH